MKRRLLIIGIFLLLGAVVNVAVAWGIAAWGRPHTPFGDPPTRLAAQRIWDRYAMEGWPPFNGYNSGTNWGWTAVSAWSSGGDYYHLGQVRVGSPIRTFQYGWYYDGGYPYERVLFNGWLARSEPRLILPYEPIWPGFAFNTIFYAAILWLLIPGPFTLRRFLRLRRGLCPACAYQMGESGVCTECGVELPSRPAAT